MKKEWRCFVLGQEKDDVVLFADETPESAAEAAAEHFSDACEESGRDDEANGGDGAVWIVVREVDGNRAWRVETAPYEVTVRRARDKEQVDA